MRFVDVTARAGELCLYLCTVGWWMFPAGDRGGMWLFLVLSLLAQWACARAAEKWRGPARYLPVLLLVPLAWGQGAAAALRCAPVAILLLVRCHRRQWRAEYYTAENLFRAGGCVCLAEIVVVAAFAGTERLVTDALPFCVGWLLLTVLSLRLLRNPYVAGLDGRSKALNAALLAAVAALVAVLSSPPVTAAAVAAVRTAWSAVVGPVVYVVLYAAAVVLTLVAYAVGWLFWRFGGGGEEPPRMDMGSMGDMAQTVVPEAVEPRQWVVRALIAAAVAIFLLAAWRVARSITGPAPEEIQDPGALRRESLPGTAKKRRRSGGRAAAEGVRETYRKYLALCASLGIPVDGTAASDVIAERSAPWTGAEDAGALREQWLEARFSGREPGSEDVRRARQTLRRMRESVRARRGKERRKLPQKP